MLSLYAKGLTTGEKILPDDRCLLASTVFNVAQQAMQVAGFTAGGVFVGLIDSRPALLADAATFAAPPS